MAFVLSSISGNLISAASAGFAPTNKLDVSAIASAYAESAASSKQDELTFGYDENDRIDAINGSALAGQGGGELVTSIQSALDPWYQTSISGLNGSSLYPKWAESAKSARNAYTADFAAQATSAGAAPTAWASSLITGVTSPSGTIRVIGGTSLEGTNSAILPSTIIEGFSTSFDGNTLGPSVKLHCVFPTANPSTEIIMPFYYGSGRILLSSDNGGIENSWEKDHSPETITAQVPNATAVDIWVDNSWIPVNSVTASAATQEIGGGVGELAWASALPTYEYDAEDKISAINGSAIAGGGGGATGDYVENSASSVAIGTDVSASGISFAQGSGTLASADSIAIGWGARASSNSVALGYLNSAMSGSMAQGERARAYYSSMAQGGQTHAGYNSFAQGKFTEAYDSSMAQGYFALASGCSFAQGVIASANASSVALGPAAYASGNSFACGFAASAINSATVLGLNNLSGDGSGAAGAAFAIGDGTAYDARHDLMVVTKDGEITMYSSTADTTGTGIMSSIRALSANAGGVDSATVSAIASSYAESAVSSYQPLSGMSGYASAFSAGEGLEFVQSGSDQVLQVEAPVDIVAGPGIVIDNPDGNTLRVSTDENYETVLWDGNGTPATISNLVLSESVKNFERVRITFSSDLPGGSPPEKNIQDVERPTANGDWFSVVFSGGIATNLFHLYTGVFAFTTNGTKFTYHSIYHCWGHGSGSYEQSSGSIKCLKVVGIHRIANN